MENELAKLRNATINVSNSIKEMDNKLNESVIDIVTLSNMSNEIIKSLFNDMTSKLEGVINTNRENLNKSISKEMNKIQFQFDKSLVQLKETNKILETNNSKLLENVTMSVKSINSISDLNQKLLQKVEAYLEGSQISTEKHLDLVEEQLDKIKDLIEKDNQEDLVARLQQVIDALDDQKGEVKKGYEVLSDNNNQNLAKYSNLWNDISNELNDTALRHDELLGLLKSHYKVLQQVVSEM